MIRDHLRSRRNEYTHWLNHGSMAGSGQSYEQTIDNVYELTTNRVWTTGLLANLITILNGARSLGELYNPEIDGPVRNRTHYEHHDQGTSPRTHPARRTFTTRKER